MTLSLEYVYKRAIRGQRAAWELLGVEGANRLACSKYPK